jgi:hypothetical protein
MIILEAEKQSFLHGKLDGDYVTAQSKNILIPAGYEYLGSFPPDIYFKKLE